MFRTVFISKSSAMSHNINGHRVDINIIWFDKTFSVVLIFLRRAVGTLTHLIIIDYGTSFIIIL